MRVSLARWVAASKSHDYHMIIKGLHDYRMIGCDLFPHLYLQSTVHGTHTAVAG